ncbi:AMP-dependent synthetase and ligase [Leucosporidium creatinivorum]|uniref:AMP-dependent synthetase and ligase n=1 Tax=Leucosporidium creatinivorum TaxID=106004 RepID=A0A1Y2G074_9BASI|nr:AMP-dependent synthetase and ligase [Leucosporidium creatinivorum]
MPPFPARTFAECHEIMTAPGAVWELEEKEIRGLQLKVYKNAPPSIRAVWLASKEFGSRDYLVYENERYTSSQAHTKVNALASLFYHKYGIRQGDRIAICARNLPEWIFSFWATQLLGAVSVAVNAWLPPAAMIHCLTTTTPRLVVLDAERAKILAGAVEEMDQVGGTRKVLVMRAGGEVPKGMSSLEGEVASWSDAESKLPEVEIHPEDVATIFFTSGTTGLPKGVVGSNRQYTTNLMNSLINAGRAYLRRGEDIPTPDATAEQKAMLLSTPLFHAVGNHSSLGLCTALGFRIVLIHRWDVSRVAQLVIAERITHGGGIPFMAMELLEAVKLASGSQHVLESVAWGGAPSSAGLPQEVQGRLGREVMPSQGYGATETSSMATGVCGEDYLLRPTTAGLPTFVTTIKIVSEDNISLPAGSVGEILVHGVSRTYGYWRNEKATKEAFTADGYYRTGDLGYLDDEGFLYISDRAKDIIIRGGENISSVSVETEIYRHPAVLDAAVVPVPDAKLGELVAAAIVLRPEFSTPGAVSSQEIIELVASALPKHCVPVMVSFRDALPRNGVGKTDKRILKEALSKIWLGQQQKEHQLQERVQVQVQAKL